MTHDPGYDGGPFFSPDGTRIVWRHFTPEGMTADVFTMKLDGSDRKRITDFGAMSWAPYFHPSGKYIVFTTNTQGFENFELYIVDAAGAKEPVRITFTDGFDGLPVFSPDGKKLCWTSGPTERRQAVADLHRGLERRRARKAIDASPARRSETRRRRDVLARDPRVRYEARRRVPRRRRARRPHDRFARREKSGRLDREPFQQVGLKPLGKRTASPFPFTSGVKRLPGKNTLSVTVGAKPRTLAVEKDFRPLAYSENATVDGPLAFAGYGLVSPKEPATRL